MEGLIDLELAGELERKIFLAFLKGMSQIKFRSQFRKLHSSSTRKQHRVGGAAAEEPAEDESESIDLEYLYTNLFQGTSLQSEQFN